MVYAPTRDRLRPPESGKWAITEMTPVQRYLQHAESESIMRLGDPDEGYFSGRDFMTNQPTYRIPIDEAKRIVWISLETASNLLDKRANEGGARFWVEHAKRYAGFSGQDISGKVAEIEGHYRKK